MLRRAALVRTDVSGENIASIIRVPRIGDLGTTLALTSNRSMSILATLIMVAIRSSELLLFTKATRRHIPKDGILHSHNRENLKPYIELTGWAL
jgi:hypothetical protein